MTDILLTIAAVAALVWLIAHQWLLGVERHNRRAQAGPLWIVYEEEQKAYEQQKEAADAR